MVAMAVPATAGLITYEALEPGIPTRARFDARFNKIYNEFNGLTDGDNIKDGSLSDADINYVSGAKIYYDTDATANATLKEYLVNTRTGLALSESSDDTLLISAGSIAVGGRWRTIATGTLIDSRYATATTNGHDTSTGAGGFSGWTASDTLWVFAVADGPAEAPVFHLTHLSTGPIYAANKRNIGKVTLGMDSKITTVSDSQFLTVEVSQSEADTDGRFGDNAGNSIGNDSTAIDGMACTVTTTGRPILLAYNVTIVNNSPGVAGYVEFALFVRVSGIANNDTYAYMQCRFLHDGLTDPKFPVTWCGIINDLPAGTYGFHLRGKRINVPGGTLTARTEVLTQQRGYISVVEIR